MTIYPVILSGGSGTRLWPMSRQRQPKQFAPLLGQECLFEATLRSVARKPDFGPPIIVGNAEHKFIILDILAQSHISDASVILEPLGRNTAAAALAAALADTETNADILHLVRPSDHVIANEESFYEAVHRAAPVAMQGAFVLFGVAPTYAETGYGYISPAKGKDKNSVQDIAAFHEKPDAEMAQKLIDGGALWNSGIFLYPPRLLIEEAAKLAPDLLAECARARRESKKDMGCTMLDTEAYRAMTSDSFDRVFMERTSRGKVMSCAMGWNDVGSWRALWQLTGKNDDENFSAGPVILRNMKGSYVRSDGPTVAAMGLEDIMIVAAKDAILVAPLSQSQNIRELVADVCSSNSALVTEHPRVMRPWGSYEGVAQGRNFQVKRIIVRPGRSLSLQMHHHRAEHWVVVEGTAKIQCGDEEKLVFPNESAYIPRGAKHRLSNPGKVDLHLIEIQCGDYLGEDDIVRFDDNYGRKS